MKIGNKVSFGVSAVISGQKSATVNAAPQLIANSTLGKFVITSPVSKALNVAVGENVMFLNNIAGVEAAIAERVADVVAYAEENGIDLNTREGQDAVLGAFTQWFIAKGQPMYDGKGNPIMASERYTKEDKLNFIKDHGTELLEANRDALIERVGNADASDEELIATITVDDIESPKYHACSGSKTATSSSTTGVGCQLNFTDTSIWTALKADLEVPTSKNRVYDVLLNEAARVDYNNGREVVEITIFPIQFVKDEEPIARNKA